MEDQAAVVEARKVGREHAARLQIQTQAGARALADQAEAEPRPDLAQPVEIRHAAARAVVVRVGGERAGEADVEPDPFGVDQKTPDEALLAQLQDPPPVDDAQDVTPLSAAIADASTFVHAALVHLT